MEDDIVTRTGNRISRSAVLFGSANIELGGNCTLSPGATVRGDLALLRFGSGCVLGCSCVIRPSRKQHVFVASRYGNNVQVGENAVVQAASVGDGVRIGKNAVIGVRAQLHRHCRVLPGTVLPRDAVIPPFATVGGAPGRVLSDEHILSDVDGTAVEDNFPSSSSETKGSVRGGSGDDSWGETTNYMPIDNIFGDRRPLKGRPLAVGGDNSLLNKPKEKSFSPERRKSARTTPKKDDGSREDIKTEVSTLVDQKNASAPGLKEEEAAVPATSTSLTRKSGTLEGAGQTTAASNEQGIGRVLEEHNIPRTGALVTTKEGKT
ncbi:unnamed protein product [Amoebophrya sp. A25]|nr:unnamed protein product [Amoebophrya sp. A25]|eukprot:GSA25T00027131001.1